MEFKFSSSWCYFTLYQKKKPDKMKILPVQVLHDSMEINILESFSRVCQAVERWPLTGVCEKKRETRNSTCERDMEKVARGGSWMQCLICTLTKTCSHTDVTILINWMYVHPTPTSTPGSTPGSKPITLVFDNTVILSNSHLIHKFM